MVLLWYFMVSSNKIYDTGNTGTVTNADVQWKTLFTEIVQYTATILLSVFLRKLGRNEIKHKFDWFPSNDKSLVFNPNMKQYNLMLQQI